MTEPNFVDKTIWTGDNLDILRGMNSATVDLIYLDPPFNSNKNYEAPVGSKAAGAAFKDTWTLSDLDVAWIGLVADEQPAVANMIDAAGRTHGKGMQSYLCMMAVRLLEMRRVLKPTGSIYLHCDPFASHYLKQLMDAVFGALQFRNEITWKRTTAHNDARRFGRVQDRLLFYVKSEASSFNRVGGEYSDEQLSRYKYKDEYGLYRAENLTAPHFSPTRTVEWRGVHPGPNRQWRFSLEELERLYAEGRILLRRDGRPRKDGYRSYLNEAPGAVLQDIWTDVELGPTARERTGYPTQKPLKLLERIIAASSNEGDMVLDPFCGCATACIAAQNLGRRWVGIDISRKAVELVNTRLKDLMGDLFHNRLVTVRTDIPRRTDIDAPINYRKNKHVLFGQQEGRCNGCKMDFPYKVLEVDHIVARSRGGTDHLENLQLLCSQCNRIKGNRDQAFLMAQLEIALR